MSDFDPPIGSPDPRAPAASPAPGARPRGGRGDVRIGAVFGRGVSIFVANYVAFTSMAALLFVPWIAAQRLAAPELASQVPEWLLGIIVSVGDTILAAILGATVVYGVFEQLRGRRPDLAACVSKGLSRILPVLGVTIVAGMLTGLVGVAAVIAGVVGASADASAGASALAALGVLAAGLLGLFFLIRLWVAVPVAVVEQVGVGKALRRSWQLTSGRMFKVFGVLFLLGVVLGLLGVAVALPLDAVTLERWGQPALQVLLAALGPVVSAVGYHDLRMSREGIEASELAAVFE